ncbi:MAG TPA: exosortase/archaeosortase family protein [Opitutaceae bacterium]|nr:exosortase/archaeosortase family protein [Opitutaceae bacterium]
MPGNAIRFKRLGFAVVGGLWTLTWWRQHFVWSSVPEYQFGWVVPALSVFLFGERWQTRPRPGESPSCWVWVFLALIGGGLLTFSRLCLEAFPQWPGMLWLFTLSALAISLGIAGTIGGRKWAGHFAFPFCFALVALPWPEVVRQPLVVGLTPAITATAANLVNELGQPAIVRGNVIEVSSGLVGVEEACSGIRSLQSIVMIALFLGEYGRFAVRRRWALLAIGIGLAVVANFLRTSFLVWEAARHGAAAIAQWHDAVGYATLGLTIGSLVLIAWRWSRTGPPPASPPLGYEPAATQRFPIFLLGLVAALLLTGEFGTRWWYHRPDPGRADADAWTVEFPREQPGFHVLPISPDALAMLGCDQAEGGFWNAADGAKRGGYFLRWQTGQKAQYAVLLHNPKICFPMSGMRLVAELSPVQMQVGRREITFQTLRFEEAGEEFSVFYCAVEMSSGRVLQAPADQWRDWANWRWQEIRAGRRKQEMQVLTLALWNVPRDDRAREALQFELSRVLRFAAGTPTHSAH